MPGSSEPMTLCARCGAAPRGVSVEGRDLCDRCADREIAGATGWPELPAPPPPEVIFGPMSDRHIFRYRLFRWPGRVTAVAEEVGCGDGGHRLEIGVDHFDDPLPLVARIRAAARSAVGRFQLAPDEQGRLQLESSEVFGRIEEAENPYENPRVVIDARSFSWSEFGELLRSYVGWPVHLRFGDDAEVTSDAKSVRTGRPDAEALQLLRREAPPWFVISLDHYPTPEAWRRHRLGGGQRPDRDGGRT